MPSVDENFRLLWLIISQKLVDGQITDIDWNKVAAGLNLERDTAARLRWSRLKKELTEKGLTAPVTSADANNSPKAATKTKTKNPNEKVTKVKATKDKEEKPKRAAKKRKVEVEEDDASVVKHEGWADEEKFQVVSDGEAEEDGGDEV